MLPWKHDIDIRLGRGTEEVVDILHACLGEDRGLLRGRPSMVMVICVEQISDSHPTHDIQTGYVHQ